MEETKHMGEDDLGSLAGIIECEPPNSRCAVSQEAGIPIISISLLRGSSGGVPICMLPGAGHGPDK
eukprot:1158733-Pelagomonas_calceolata.AAC.6